MIRRRSPPWRSTTPAARSPPWCVTTSATRSTVECQVDDPGVDRDRDVPLAHGRLEHAPQTAARVARRAPGRTGGSGCRHRGSAAMTGAFPPNASRSTGGGACRRATCRNCGTSGRPRRTPRARRGRSCRSTARRGARPRRDRRRRTESRRSACSCHRRKRSSRRPRPSRPRRGRRSRRWRRRRRTRRRGRRLRRAAHAGAPLMIRNGSEPSQPAAASRTIA